MSELEQAALSTQGGIIDEKELGRANAILREYREGKEPIDQRIKEAEKWWLLKQWEVYDQKAEGKAGGSERRTASAWLFNAIVGAQADAIAAYPEPIFYPRERGDEKEADMLSKIMPVILQQNGFEETYSKGQWQKLKTGTGAYGVFWDKSLLNGLGDISIRRVNMLNLFYQPGIDDIQASQNVFHTEMVDRKYLLSKYPELQGKPLDSFEKVDPQTEEKVKTDDLVEVVDWYYHRMNMHGKKVLHYAKFVGTALIYATENDLDPELDEMTGQIIRDAPAVTGLYDDAEYPFDLDPLYPIDGSPTGLGMVYIGRSAQENIDRLQSKIVQVAIMGATPRYFSYNNSINEEEFADWAGSPIVHVHGSNGRNDVEQITSPSIDSMFVQVRNDLIEELKQTLGMTDVAMGNASSGVTAASAYAILDENAGKPRRASSSGSYRMYGRMIGRVVERIRQFYDTPRTFRILGDSGEQEFVDYDNSGIALRPQQGESELYEKPVFDIEVRAQKQTVYTRMSQNEMAIQFFQMGVFNPQMADAALKMITLMDFKDKEKVTEMIREAMLLTDQLKHYQELALLLTAEHKPEMYEPLLQEIMASDPMAAQTMRSRAAPPRLPDNGDPRKHEAAGVQKARQMVQNSSQPQ